VRPKLDRENDCKAKMDLRLFLFFENLIVGYSLRNYLMRKVVIK
jgi:hypothetical protein